jgi:hypothetical protein
MKVVVVGAGYASTLAANRLARKVKDAEIMVINPRPDFVERVRMTQQVAGTGTAATPIAEMLRKGVSARVGAVEKIGNGTVALRSIRAAVPSWTNTCAASPTNESLSSVTARPCPDPVSPATPPCHRTSMRPGTALAYAEAVNSTRTLGPTSNEPSRSDATTQSAGSSTPTTPPDGSTSPDAPRPWSKRWLRAVRWPVPTPAQPPSDEYISNRQCVEVSNGPAID